MSYPQGLCYSFRGCALPPSSCFTWKVCILQNTSFCYTTRNTLTNRSHGCCLLMQNKITIICIHFSGKKKCCQRVLDSRLFFLFFLKKIRGFPGGAVVENLPASVGDTGSSPGLGGSHMPQSNWACEPQLLSLRVWSLCSATREAATVRGPRTAMKIGPRLPQLEKALAQKRRPNTAKNK